LCSIDQSAGFSKRLAEEQNGKFTRDVRTESQTGHGR
jgi:hypothetical protein